MATVSTTTPAPPASRRALLASAGVASLASSEASAEEDLLTASAGGGRPEACPALELALKFEDAHAREKELDRAFSAGRDGVSLADVKAAHEAIVAIEDAAAECEARSAAGAFFQLTVAHDRAVWLRDATLREEGIGYRIDAIGALLGSGLRALAAAGVPAGDHACGYSFLADDAPVPVLRLQGRADDPDAELVELCQAYIDACIAYDNAGAMTQTEVATHSAEIDGIRARIDDLPVQGVRGVCALARVAAHLARQQDGSEDFSAAPDWTEVVVRELLGLFGKA